jgi:chemotaxis protein MotB
MKMSKWISLSSLVFSAACVVPQSRYDRLQTEYHAENQARRQLEDEVQRKDGEVSDLRGQVNEKDSQNTELQKASAADKERIAQLQKALDDARAGMGPAGESDGVTVFRTSEGFGYSLAESLLFDSGSTEIKSGGKSALKKIAASLKEKKYSDIRIEGHTDSDPVVRTAKENPLGNHELAMKRALAVYATLVNDDSVLPANLSLAAFGPNRPLDTGKSDAAKAKNRRVEIHVAVPKKG